MLSRNKVLLALTLAVVAYFATRDASTIEATTKRRRLFIQEFAQITAKPYAEFDQLPDDEKVVRFLHAYTRELHELLQAYIASNPTEDTSILKLMRATDETVSMEFSIHDRMILESRFHYLKDEEGAAKELRDRAATLVGEIGSAMERK